MPDLVERSRSMNAALQLDGEHRFAEREPLQKLSMLDRTDVGNARLLVRRHGRDLRHFRARGVWLLWDGSRGKYDTRGAIERLAVDTADALWEASKAIDDEDAQKLMRGWAAKSHDSARIMGGISRAAGFRVRGRRFGT